MKEQERNTEETQKKEKTEETRKKHREKREKRNDSFTSAQEMAQHVLFLCFFPKCLKKTLTIVVFY